MSKFLDEQDFNSDTETIERNKNDLLQHVTTAIARFAKSDPVKFVDNLKTQNPETDAASLEKHVAEVRQHHQMMDMQLPVPSMPAPVAHIAMTLRSKKKQLAPIVTDDNSVVSEAAAET